MKKTLKFIGIFVLCVVVLVVGMILALPLWIGPVAKGVANSVVPGITGTGFHLGEFGFNPYTGGIHVGDMQLANPTNFSEKNAVDLKALDVDFAMTSLLGGKKYVVESVDLDGIVVYCDATASNFRQIAENAAGEPKADDRPAVTKLADEAKVQPAEPAERQEAPADEAKEGGKGVQINRVTLKNVTIKYGVVPLAVPMDIVLTDIGKDAEEGAAFEDVALMIRDKVLGAAGFVGGKLGDLGKGALEAGAGAISAAGDAVKGVGDTLVGAGGAASDAVKGAGDALKSAGGAAGDAVKSAGEGLKNLFK